MKQHIENLLKNAVLVLAKDHEIPENVINNIKVERAKDKAHGDSSGGRGAAFLCQTV